MESTVKSCHQRHREDVRKRCFLVTRSIHRAVFHVHGSGLWDSRFRCDQLAEVRHVAVTAGNPTCGPRNGGSRIYPAGSSRCTPAPQCSPTAVGIQKNLGSRLIMGIGPVMADRMVAHHRLRLVRLAPHLASRDRPRGPQARGPSFCLMRVFG